MTLLLIILAIVLLIIGAAGTIYPALPGLPIMLIAAALLAYSSDFTIIGSGTLIIISILTVLGWATDFLASTLGAKYTGASKQALYGSFIGGIIGIFFGFIGILLGPLLGAAIGELIARRDILLASKVGLGTFIGFIIGVASKIGTAIMIILIILWQYAAHYWA